MNCPVCGYVMTAFEQECARCKNSGQNSRAFPQTAQPEARPYIPQRDVPQPDTRREFPAAYQPNWVNIGLMWGLSVLAFIITVVGALSPVAPASVGLFLVLVLGMDLVAIVLAFILAGSDSPTDRIHGKVKLGLAAASWLLRVVTSLHSHG